MLDFDQWKFPDHERHLQGWMQNVNKRVDGRLTYQYGKYEIAMRYVTNKKLAIDVGAHVGLWSYFMARDFAQVHCFEPMPEHAECWRINMANRENAQLYECALGNDYGNVSVRTRTPDSSGDTGIIPGEAGHVSLLPLDYFTFDAPVGFIKIDCEGYEENVLRGAESLLKNSKPVVLVEQKGTMSQQYGFEKLSAVRYLESLGAKLQAEVSGDYILSWV